jgi:hypothetical protein
MNTLKLFLPAFVGIVLLSGCDGCNKIKLPNEDQTPPTCKWEVNVLDNDSTFQFSNGGTLIMANTYNVRVYFTVSDNDGGVKRISVTGSGTKAYPQMLYVYDWGSQNKLDWNEDVSGPPDGKNMVVKSRTLLKQFDFTPQPGNPPGDIHFPAITPAGGSLNLHGVGENYHRGTCTSNLTIIAAPKQPVRPPVQ